MQRFALVCVVTFFIHPSICWAQAVAGGTLTDVSPDEKPSLPLSLPSDGFPDPLPSRVPDLKQLPAGFWKPFRSVPSDFVRLLSADTVKVVGVGGAGALGIHRVDDKGIQESQEHFRPRLFRTGNVGGSLLVQTGASVGLYALTRFAGAHELTNFSGDLVRAQLLTQGLVQAGKFATHRLRPDGSNNFSLPSGHAAAAFATATVVQRRFGWKFGGPAYAFGAYVGASRMAANKHHLSDVVLGATIGIAAGRTVTVGRQKGRFQMGVAPTPGGAAITFTKN